MQPTFLFYDIETTGLSKAFDQVLQFAAIRTDRTLKEIDRHEWIVKLNPDVIPTPRAMITHGIALSDIHQGENEFEVIKKIHALFNQPGTISLGYNTLGFDDEFLRFSFYRNLLSPYTHQYANDCGRMDLYPLTAFYFLFKNSILSWPDSLKLEKLNAANQFIQGSAHNAMVDVEATLAMARIFLKEGEMWNYISGYFNKRIDQERVSHLKIGLCIDGIFGREQRYQCPVLFLGNHKYYKNQSIWLRLDQDIIENPWIIRKKWGEPSFILPMQDRFLKHLSPDRKNLSDQHVQHLTKHPDILEKMAKHYTEFQYPIFPNADTNARLYVDGFWNPMDENFCRAFHAAPSKEKSKLIEKHNNPTLKALAIRILGRHFKEDLPDSLASYFNEYMQKIYPETEEAALIDYQGNKRFTQEMAFAEIAELYASNSLTEKQSGSLKALENYLTSVISGSSDDYQKGQDDRSELG